VFRWIGRTEVSKVKDQRLKDKGRFKGNEPSGRRTDQNAESRQRTEARHLPANDADSSEERKLMAEPISKSGNRKAEAVGWDSRRYNGEGATHFHGPLITQVF